MKKHQIGFMDLLPPEIRREIDLQKEANETWDAAIAFLRDELGKGDSDVNGLAVELVRAGKEYPLDDLLDTYKRETEDGIPHDPQVEELFIELLSTKQVRTALFKRGRGKPPPEDKTDRDLGLACEVHLLLRGGYKKGDAYTKVADKNAVSKSTVRDAYRDYGDAAREIHQ